MASDSPAELNPMHSDSYEFSLPQHLKDQSNIVEIVNGILGTPTNIIIRIGKERFFAHGEVLRHSSPVFKAMLSDPWRRDNVYELSEQFVDSSIFDNVLNFFYTTKITLTNDNCYSILITADYLNIPSLLAMAEEFLFWRVNRKEEILMLFLLAEGLNLKILRQRCIDVIRSTIWKSDGESNFINNHNLSDFWEKDLEKLYSELKDPREYHLYCFHQDSQLNAGPRAPARKMEALDPSQSWYLLQDFLYFLKDIISGIRTTIFSLPPVSEVLVTTISHLNPLTKKWEHIQEPLAQRKFFGGTVVGDKIYLCGGFRFNPKYGWEKLKSIVMFDCVNETFTELPNMPDNRSCFGMAELNDYLYVAGGIVDYSRCKSVLRYSIEKREWKSVASMPEPGFGYHLVALNGYLYAICGRGGQSMVRYCPKTDQWLKLSNPKMIHVRLAVAVHYGKIYVQSDNFEVYNPITDIWRVLPSPKQSSWTPGRTLVSINGRLLSVRGGCNAKVARKIQEFNIYTDQWTPEPDIGIPRFHRCSFVARF